MERPEPKKMKTTKIRKKNVMSVSDSESPEKVHEVDKADSVPESLAKVADTKCASVNTSNEERGKASKKKGKKKYYVLFLGNLPYDTKAEEVREHFVRCGVIEDVRILTKKETGKPRGCAYIQFEDMRGHKNALMLHKSDFKGREINVEFTAPGRKNANRSMRLKEKNKRLAKYKLSRDCIL